MTDVGKLNAKLSLKLSEAEVAATIGKLQAKIDVLGKKLSTALGKDATTATNKTTDSMKKLDKTTSNWVWTATSGVKAISRVVYGILISQMFYRLIGAIQEAARSLWQFNIQMEQTELAFEILLGSVEAGQAFVDMLEDFAAVTPFVMENTTSMARRLLSVGFSVREVLIVMRGVVDAMAIMGTRTESLDNLVTAISHIKAIGAEFRYIKSIGKTGIPIFDILKKQLGVTEEQIRSGYLLGLPRAQVITAILKGINEAFKDGAIKLSRTVGGLLSTIQDNLLLISKGLFSGLFTITKGYIERIADRLQYLRNAMRKFGAGGFFEALVPAHMQDSVRLLIGYLAELGKAIRTISSALAPVIQEMVEITTMIHQLILPSITYLIRGLASFTENALKTRIAARALAGAIMAVAAAIIFFRRAVIAKPFLVGLAAIAGAVLAIASASATAARWLSILKAKFTSLFGFSTSEILQPIAQEVPELDLDTQIAAISDEMEELEDTTTGAANALNKFIMPFDEVYRISEEAATGIGIPGLEDLSELGDLDWEIPIPEIEAAVDKLGELRLNFGEIFEHLIKLWKLFWETLGKIARNLIPKILASLPGLIPIFIKFFGRFIATVLATIGLGLGAVIVTILRALSVILTTIITFISGVLLPAILGDLPTFLKMLWAAAGVIITNIALLLVPIANALVYGVTQIAINLGIALSQMMMQSGVLLGIEIAKFGVMLMSALSELFMKTTIFMQIAIANAADYIITGMRLGFSKIWDEITAFFTFMNENAKTAVTGFGRMIGTLLAEVLSDPLAFTTKEGASKKIKAVVQEWGKDMLQGFEVYAKEREKTQTTFDEEWITSQEEAYARALARVESYNFAETEISKFWSNILLGLEEDKQAAMLTIADKHKIAQLAVSKLLNDSLMADNEFMNKSLLAANEKALEDLALYSQDFGANMEPYLTIWIPGVTEQWQGFFSDTEKLFSATGDIITPMWKDMFSDFGDSIMTWWDTEGNPIWSGTMGELTTMLSDAKGEAIDIWGELSKAIMTVEGDIGESTVQMSNAMTRFQEFADKEAKGAANAFETMGTDISTAMGTAMNSAQLSVENIEEPIKTSMGITKDNIIDNIEAVVEPVNESAQLAAEGYTEMWKTEVDTNLLAVFESIDDLLLNQRESVAQAAGAMADAAILAMDRKFKDFHPEIEVRIKIPDIKVPAVEAGTTLSGFTIGPTALGGIINKEQIRSIAEGNKPEAVVPLTAEALNPWARAIVKEIGTGNVSTSEPARTPIYVGTLIANNQGLRELERKLYDVRVNEDRRKA